MIATMGIPEPMDILGVHVTPFTSYAHALAVIEKVVQTGPKTFWVAINPQKVYRAWRDPMVSRILSRADAGICDGVGVSLAARILYGHKLRRCTGCDLFFKILDRASERGWRVYLLGASPESNRRAAENLRKSYPDLQIVGRHDGYFDDTDLIVRQINASGADILFVAMGSPQQEKWILEHIEQLNARFYLGVGGSFDVASGVNRRAPLVMRKLGMEFIYQLVRQPWRIRRQVVYVPFMLRVLRARMGRLLSQRAA